MSKVAVILFPGSNCELEAVRACQRSGIQAEIFRWNDAPSKLKNFDAFIIPGGFSYEDRGRSGIVASKEHIMETLKKEALSGKPMLGICNGAQVLVETGLIPGMHTGHLEMALAMNERYRKEKILGVGYYNDWIYMRSASKQGRSIFNRFSAKKILNVPVAHGEGRFTSREKQILQNLIKNDQTLFRYCDKNGKFVEDFPTNPNGSLYNLAGVCNKEGNILALMPHPERTLLGQPIFDSLADALQSTKKTPVAQPRLKAEISEKIEPLSQKPDITILIRLVITDNEEKTLESTVKRMGYSDVKLKRQVFLGFYVKEQKELKKTAGKLIESGELLNLNKEIPTVFIGKKVYEYKKGKGLVEGKNPLPKGFHFFVTLFNNYSGKNIQAHLKQHFKNNMLQQVEHGIFWTIQMKNTKNVQKILGTHLFHNPHSMRAVSFNTL
jgi:phosphoribosylformylglycinamidine synthase I